MRIAAISVHGCPVIQAGGQDAGGMNIYVLETARRLTALGATIDVFAAATTRMIPRLSILRRAQG